MAETSGERLYKIRLACGDGVRTAESLRAFSDRVFTATRVRYDPMTLSLLERMKQGWKLDDARLLASVDPLKRGAGWLSALDVEQAPVLDLPDPTKDRKLTEQEAARAVRKSDLNAARRAAKQGKKGRRGGNGSA